MFHVLPVFKMSVHATCFHRVIESSRFLKSVYFIPSKTNVLTRPSLEERIHDLNYANLTNNFLFSPRYVSGTPCEVSLLQHASPACKVSRNAALNENKKIWTLKHDPDLHGFALLNMTSEQLGAIAVQDPFIRYYASAYLQITQASSKSFDLYNNITAGQEITELSEYLKLSTFFQSALEPAIGVSMLFYYSKTEFNCIKP